MCIRDRCLLFNIVLEKVFRGASIQTRGTMFFKSVQLLAYADDIDIMGRSENDVKKAFTALYHSAEEMGLMVN